MVPASLMDRDPVVYPHLNAKELANDDNI